MLDTIEHYLDGNCSITFIDPYPATLRYLMGTSTAQILEKSVQDVAVEIFSALAAGDVLFIDSSHVLRTGSDVCFELFEILPTAQACWSISMICSGRLNILAHGPCTKIARGTNFMPCAPF